MAGGEPGRRLQLRVSMLQSNATVYSRRLNRGAKVCQMGMGSSPWAATRVG